MDDEQGLEMLASLLASEGYTQQDRYLEFRKLFTGSAEGRRVLREILSWGHLLKPSLLGNPIDPYHVLVLEGERNIALRLFATVNKEPRERPAQAKRSK